MLFFQDKNDSNQIPIETPIETTTETQEEELTEEELDEMIEKEKIDSLKLLEKLNKSNNYSILQNNDSSFYDKYKSLEFTIYHENIYSFYNLNNDLIKSSIFNYTSLNDIDNIEKKEDKIYGYINKDIVDKKIKSLFNSKRIKVELTDAEDIYSNAHYDYNFINISNKLYRYVNLNNLKNNKYEVVLLDNIGTIPGPRVYPFPMKITNVKKYDEYILVTSKAVYTQGSQKSMKIYNKINMDSVINDEANKIGNETTKDFPFCKIDINKYIDKASTIYTIFKKDGDNYYFYRNFVNN